MLRCVKNSKKVLKVQREKVEKKAVGSPEKGRRKTGAGDGKKERDKSSEAQVCTHTILKYRIKL